MKKYAKPQMMAKNAPTGSYAAGCPQYQSAVVEGTGRIISGGKYVKCGCKTCEVAK